MISVVVNARGVLQTTLASRICDFLAYAARWEGKSAISSMRYGDSPERVGIPAEYYFVSAPSREAMEEYVAKYEPGPFDVIVVLDDTLIKGSEPWGHVGVKPINEGLKRNGVLLVVTEREIDELIGFLPRRKYRYRMAAIPGKRSFSGFWVFKDDLTDARVLGGIAKTSPEALSLEVLKAVMVERYPKAEKRIEAAEDAYRNIAIRVVKKNEGLEAPKYAPKFPDWDEIPEGLAIPSVPEGNRNPHYHKYTTRTERPVVDYDKCTKCTLCWLYCPDGAFDVTEEGYFDPNYFYCPGCSVCAEICPVKCIDMVDELEFKDNSSLYGEWRKSPRVEG
ncbi:MAG: 4Fe-4S dicluster-binding protein [Candidatus Geothermarchaeales archaeon]